MAGPSHLESVKQIHRRRRRDGVCIGNAAHGAAYKGGRCRPCWVQKLKRERASYAAKIAQRGP